MGFFDVKDPGASGTISWVLSDYVICQVVTAAAESRALEAATSYAVGTKCVVIFKTDGGDLTITGADVSVVLQNAGDIVEFVVTTSGSTHAWRIASDSRAEAEAFGAVQVAIPFELFRVHDAYNVPLPVVAADDDDLELLTPAIGTDATAISATVSNASVTKEAIVSAIVPANYRAGSPISIVIPWTRPDAATTSASLDLTAWRQAAPTVDVNSTALVDINAAASGTATFVLTPTDIVPNEIILLNLLVAIVDGTTSLQTLTKVSWSYTV